MADAAIPAAADEHHHNSGELPHGLTMTPAAPATAAATAGPGLDAPRLEHPAWGAALQEPSDLVPALRAQGALLCAELCAQAGAAARDAAAGAGAWAEAAALGRELEAVAWEGLHSGQAWRDVTEATRRAYAQAQFVLAAHDLSQGQPRASLRRLDMALLMGPPTAHGAANALAELVQATALLLEPEPVAAAANDEEQEEQAPSSSSSSSSCRKRPRPWAAPVADTVPRVACPSLHQFLEQHLKPQLPLILTGCMAQWPACEAGGARAWRDMAYLKRVAGARTVPVEVGKGTYLSAEEGGWGQRLMTLGEFIDRFVVAAANEREEKGYLAQHELFAQLPALRRDILVPDYCALEDEGGDGDDADGDGDVIVNAWFGPAGTVSPTHTDPYHNLLAQVVGAKAIRLFPPAQTPCLYPHRGLMHNNSQIDPKAPDLARFPRFARAAPLHCVLEEGEMLYIPPLWWHHIESLAVSFSVSFWWGRRRETPPPPVEEEEEGS